jgi:hypothetical protein
LIPLAVLITSKSPRESSPDDAVIGLFVTGRGFTGFLFALCRVLYC